MQNLIQSNNLKITTKNDLINQPIIYDIEENEKIENDSEKLKGNQKPLGKFFSVFVVCVISSCFINYSDDDSISFNSNNNSMSLNSYENEIKNYFFSFIYFYFALILVFYSYYLFYFKVNSFVKLNFEKYFFFKKRNKSL